MATPKYTKGQKVKYLFRLTEIRTGIVAGIEEVDGTFQYRIEGMMCRYAEEDLFEIKEKVAEVAA